jgi:hypothetical protein
VLDESPGLAEVFTNAAVLAAQLTVQRTAEKQLPALASLLLVETAQRAMPSQELQPCHTIARAWQSRQTC